MTAYVNRAYFAVSNTPGSSGNFTVSTAESGYRTLGSADNGKVFDVMAIEGTSWEVRTGCTYTHSGTSLSRGTLEESSTGSAITFTSAVKVMVVQAAAKISGVDSLAGAFALETVSVTGATTATIGKMHLCSGTSADYTVTLPAASGNAGRYIGFQMASGLTKLVTIDGNASETIDGATTRIMWADEVAILWCNGSNWFKVAGRSIPMSIRARRTTNQTGINGSTWTPVSMTTKDFGPDFMWDSTNGRINIKRAGQYEVISSAYVNVTSGSQTGAYITAGVNGTNLAWYQQSGDISGNAAGTFVTLLNVSVNDYVATFIYSLGATSVQALGAGEPTLAVMECSQW